MADDPEIVSDVLFAMANVMSFARTTVLMPAFEILGPLQIAFNRMITDISRFMVLFILVTVPAEIVDLRGVRCDVKLILMQDRSKGQS